MSDETSAQTRPAGWYPDPGGGTEMRWWDGSRWTYDTLAAGDLQAAEQSSIVRVRTVWRTLRAMRRARETTVATVMGGEHELASRYRGTQPLPGQHESAKDGRSRIPALLIVGAMLAFVGATTMVNLVDPTGPGEDWVSPEVRWWILAGAVMVAIAAGWAWRRYWLIADTPTVEVSGAHPGVCELVGHARPSGQPATAWFTGAPCVWSRSAVQRLTGSGKNRSWRTEWQGGGGSLRFRLVGDEGGSIDVDTTGARRFAGDRQLVEEKVGDDCRITENGIVENDRIYVLGMVTMDYDGRLVVRKPNRRRTPLWVTQRGERVLLRNLRAIAIALTVLTVALVAAFTALEEIPSDDIGRTTELAVREQGALLFPAVAAAGAVVVAYILAYVWRLWNRLVEVRGRASSAWSLIDVAARERHDLIGNLVAVTKAAAAHERTAQVTATVRRGLPGAAGAAGLDDVVSADSSRRAFVVAHAEAHPELKVDETYRRLFDGLVRTENRLAASRRFYNDAITILADRTGTFPGVLLKRFVAPTLPPLLHFDLHEAAPPGEPAEPSHDASPVDPAGA